MLSEGKIWEDDRFWVVEISSLGVTTQGKSRKDALSMIQDAVFELMKSYFGTLNKKTQNPPPRAHQYSTTQSKSSGSRPF